VPTNIVEWSTYEVSDEILQAFNHEKMASSVGITSQTILRPASCFALHVEFFSCLSLASLCSILCTTKVYCSLVYHINKNKHNGSGEKSSFLSVTGCYTHSIALQLIQTQIQIFY